jgi:hypothetical protein
MPRAKDTKPLSTPLSEKGYELVQQAAAKKEMTINDYVRRALVAQMRADGHDATDDLLSPGQWGGDRKSAARQTDESAPPKKVIGFSTKRIASLPPGSVTGLLAPASRRDNYRPAGAHVWQDADDWQYGRAVDAFSLHRQYPFAVGDRLEIDSIDDGPIKMAVIRAIKMVDGETITDDDIHLLGFQDRAAWTNGGLPKRRGWLMSVELLPGEIQKPTRTTHKVEIIDGETGRTETYDTNLDRDAEN